GFQELAETPSQVLVVNDLQFGRTLERVREAEGLPYGVPAIICAMPGTGQASDSLGVFDYLVKPISRQNLLACLDRIERPVDKILLVDDEPDALQLFGRMLSEGGREYQVIRASNGTQALELLRQEKPDVLLLDLVMPEMDGFQLLAVKGEDPELNAIPVILISARDPLGQPILSNSLAVTCRRGMSAREILASVDALTRILSCASSPADRALTEASPD
ncbi:MAG: response regulator, partial [Anaerolineae bacterium]